MADCGSAGRTALGDRTTPKTEGVEATVFESVKFFDVYYGGDNVEVALDGDATQKTRGVACKQDLVTSVNVVFIVFKRHGLECGGQFYVRVG